MFPEPSIASLVRLSTVFSVYAVLVGVVMCLHRKMMMDNMSLLDSCKGFLSLCRDIFSTGKRVLSSIEVFQNELLEVGLKKPEGGNFTRHTRILRK